MPNKVTKLPDGLLRIGTEIYDDYDPIVLGMKTLIDSSGKYYSTTKGAGSLIINPDYNSVDEALSLDSYDGTDNGEYEVPEFLEVMSIKKSKILWKRPTLRPTMPTIDLLPGTLSALLLRSLRTKDFFRATDNVDILLKQTEDTWFFDHHGKIIHKYSVPYMRSRVLVNGDIIEKESIINVTETNYGISFGSFVGKRKAYMAFPNKQPLRELPNVPLPNSWRTISKGQLTFKGILVIKKLITERGQLDHVEILLNYGKSRDTDYAKQLRAMSLHELRQMVTASEEIRFNILDMVNPTDPRKFIIRGKQVKNPTKRARKRAEQAIHSVDWE